MVVVEKQLQASCRHSRESRLLQEISVEPEPVPRIQVRPILLLTLPLLTWLDSNFPGNYEPGNSTSLNQNCARVKPPKTEILVG